METFRKALDLIDTSVIIYLFPLVFILIIVDYFSKGKLETRKILNLIRWIIITYTFLVFIHYIIGFIFYTNEYAFINRATGSYAWVYWLMFFGSCILPFTLLIKRLASRIFYVLLITFLMKVGMYFERFVIIITSIHRDYL